MKETILFILVLCVYTLNAQFQNMFSPTRSWQFSQAPLVNRLGVGHFPTTPNLPATLTVDGRTLNLFGQPSNQTGEVFYTYSPSTQATSWRMHRGDIEIGRIFNNSTDNHFQFRATENAADIVFRTSFNNALVNANTERMRIAHGTVSAVGGTQGTGNGNLPNGAPGREVTRVTISEDPTDPILIPRSLLHIGFDAPGTNPAFGGGWRNWMDIGTYTANRTDNMYVGLKCERPNQAQGWGDRQSAVISWGNNPQGNPVGVPDRLRFIFTSRTNPNNLVSDTQEGLEIARMVTNGNIPRMGVGDFATDDPSTNNPPTDPTNTLEIRSRVGATVLSPNSTNVTTRSGLRFRDLNSTMEVDAPSSNNKVLSVNPNGDVILVEGGSNGIQSCNNVLNGSNGSANAGIQLNTNNFYFTGSNPNFDKVGIGLSCVDPINAKIQIENVVATGILSSQTAGFFHSGGTANGAIIRAIQGVSDANVDITNIGGDFAANGQNQTVTAIGVLGSARDATRNWGGSFRATSSSTNIGGEFIAFGGSINRGIIASVATFSGGGINDAAALFNGDVFGTAGLISLSDKGLKENIMPIASALGKLSKITPYEFNFINTPYIALSDGRQYGVIAQDIELNLPELVSNITIPEVVNETGIVSYPAQTWKGVNYIGLIPITIQGVKELDATVKKLTLSDAVLKQNIQPLQNSLSLIDQLNGVSYEWNQQADTTLSFPSSTEIGLIAQQVEVVMPEVVFTDDRGYKNVSYQKIVPHLIEANKQLKDSVADLQAQLAALSQQVVEIQTCLNNLPLGMNCNNNNSHARIGNPSSETQKITLESIDAAILYQNQPNPFSENTIIRYYIPESTNEAVLVFHDEFGREINRVVLTNRGYSQIDISSEKLASGIYTYSMIIDGKLQDTKKMLKINR